MGTMGYMSPEQVRGLPVDHRSDIFSFGAILYEMLSGRRAFKQDTASDTMAAILRDEPPELSESGQHIPPASTDIVRHCLEKRPGRPVPVGQGHRLRAVGCVLVRAPRSGAQATAPAGREEARPSRCRRVAARCLAAAVPPAAAPLGAGRSRGREAPGRAALREPGRAGGRLFRRRHRGRDSRQADVSAGHPGDCPRQLHALQEDDEDAQADRRGAERLLPPHRHGPVGEESVPRVAST